MHSWWSGDHPDYETLDEIQWGGACYDFDLTRVWVHKPTGSLFVADDSGCSCPSPFESTTVGDLTPINSLWELQQYLGLDRPQADRRYGSDYPDTVDDINRVVALVEKHFAERAA